MLLPRVDSYKKEWTSKEVRMEWVGRVWETESREGVE